MSSTSVTESSTSSDHGTDLVPLVLVHVGLLVAGGVSLSLDRPAQGWGVLATVVAYVAALQVAARRSGRPDLAALAAFLVPVSVFQVLPDWVLSGLVGTLRFPDTGGVRVDDVIPLAMAGMWVAPLFVAVALAGGRPAVAAVLSAVVFLGAEIAAPTLGLWEPTGDTTRWGGVAIYVVPAEAALGWATAVAFRATRTSSVPTRVGAALAVSTFYLGALVLAFFLIDVAGWRLTA
ncbi:hypothetical protein [Aeromicrobium sp. Root472D3]|uniref:DUF6989 domain-containing protein n=1 Tax=Aeromicrobium sp. Root472D3 TaxID=1736540 RepID=UPI0006FA5C9B|nr:hypothetical protein [Aeromicrobium sp. Root472D3]KQX75963.1 hypothetical protein ASD10_12745 [Aeromicrobium sp. Root472D3]